MALSVDDIHILWSKGYASKSTVKISQSLFVQGASCLLYSTCRKTFKTINIHNKTISQNWNVVLQPEAGLFLQWFPWHFSVVVGFPSRLLVGMAEVLTVVLLVVIVVDVVVVVMALVVVFFFLVVVVVAVVVFSVYRLINWVLVLG